MIALAEARGLRLSDLPVVRLTTRWGRLTSPELPDALESGPVLVQGPQCDVEPSSWVDAVFVCVDGSDASEMVVPLAADLAGEAGARLWLLNVVTSGASPVGALGLESLHGNYLRRLAGWVSQDWDRPNWELLHHRDPARALVDHVGNRGIIAIATRGHGDASALVGSVAARILQTVRAPVLLLAPDDRRHERPVPRPVLVLDHDGDRRVAPDVDEESFVAPILRLVPSHPVDVECSRCDRTAVEGSTLCDRCGSRWR